MSGRTNCMRLFMLIVTPLVLMLIIVLPHVISLAPAHRVHLLFKLGWVYVFLLVGIYWMFNILDIATTSILVLILLPLMGTIDAKSLAFAFMSGYNIKVFGSVTLMMAAETCGLKRRLALTILKHSSGSTRWIFIDVYLATIWIAMWINSAAAVFFMMKVIDDILDSLQTEISSGALEEIRLALMNRIQNRSQKDLPEVENETTKDVKSTTTNTTSSVNDDSKQDGNVQDQQDTTMEAFKSENEQLVNGFGGELMYAAAVAANIAGILWPFGSPMGFEVMKLKYTVLFGITEASWMVYCFPLIIINGSIAFGFLHWIHYGKKFSFIKTLLVQKKERIADFQQSPETLRKVGQVFSEQHASLPRWNFRELCVLLLILIVVTLSLTRLPVFMTGWAELVTVHVYIGDSVSYITIVLLIFLIPAWAITVFKGPPPTEGKPKVSPNALGWKKLQTSYPYAILILIGASTCIGRHSEKTIAVPISEFLLKNVPIKNIALLKVIMMGLTVFASAFMPNPGTSIAITQLWYHLIRGSLISGGSIMAILSVASLCFVIPASSVPTAMIYRYKGKRTLSAWYFLRIGLPLFFCTCIPTILYALLWTSY